MDMVSGQNTTEEVGELPFPSILSPPFSFPSFPIPFPLPLEVGPLNTDRRSGEHCKLPSWVWGRAPAEIKFGTFLLYNLTSGGTSFTNFPKNYWPQCMHYL